MITLNDFSPEERRDLAAQVKSNPVYLWQCGTGLRTPSLRLADKLIDADSRLTIKGLLKPQQDRERKKSRKRKA